MEVDHVSRLEVTQAASLMHLHAHTSIISLFPPSQKSMQMMKGD